MFELQQNPDVTPAQIAVENSLRVHTKLSHITTLPYGVFTPQDLHLAKLRRQWAQQMFGKNIDQRIAERLAEQRRRAIMQAQGVKTNISAYEAGLEEVPNAPDKEKLYGRLGAGEFEPIAAPTLKEILQEQRLATPRRTSKRKRKN